MSLTPKQKAPGLFILAPIVFGFPFIAFTTHPPTVLFWLLNILAAAVGGFGLFAVFTDIEP